MREVQYKYYHIDIRDIWAYERDVFLSDRSVGRSFITSLLKKVQYRIIYNKREALDYKKELNEFTYTQYYNLYMGGNFIKHIEIFYFFYKEKMYTYKNEILADVREDDFEYWFALKLRQYETGLKHIDTFLHYQLRLYFKKDKEKMYDFLVLLLRQYEGMYFTDRLSLTVEEFMEEHLIDQEPLSTVPPKESIQKPLRSSHKQREFQGHHKTLVLEKGLKDSSYYSKHAITFARVNRLLKEAKFIDRKTNEKHFTAIFTTVQIHPSNRIQWIGTIKELQWFVKYLVYDTKKVIHLRNDIWVATLHCFVNKKGEAYTDAQLRGAKGENLDRKFQLEQILTEL